jgi:hypothetical protein
MVALNMEHNHKKIVTVMSRRGKQVLSLCERWGDEGVWQRNEAKHFCAPRPVQLLVGACILGAVTRRKTLCN